MKHFMAGVDRAHNAFRAARVAQRNASAKAEAKSPPAKKQELQDLDWYLVMSGRAEFFMLSAKLHRSL